MKKYIILCSLSILATFSLQGQDNVPVDSESVASQNTSEQVDTSQTKAEPIQPMSVVVERTFYPIIQTAGKINTPLQTLTQTPKPIDVNCSYLSLPLRTQNNFNPLVCSPTDFTTGNTTAGYVQVGGGYILSDFDFFYRVRTEQKKNLDLSANHHSQWGLKQMGLSKLGVDYSLVGKKVIYQVKGGASLTNFTYYGRYYNGNDDLTITRLASLKSNDQALHYRANVNFGIKSLPQKTMQWSLQTGYHALFIPSKVLEHSVKTYFDLYVNLQESGHRIGLDAFVQNTFLQVDKSMHIDEADYNVRHAVRIEPYYAFQSNRLRVHVGLNVDFNIGSGKQLSSSDDLSFAPSLNFKTEYDITDNWLTAFANVTGKYAVKDLETKLSQVPYINIADQITSHSIAAYTPIDIALGIYLRPLTNWLIVLRGSFASLQNQRFMLQPTLTPKKLSYLPADGKDYLKKSQVNFRRWDFGVQTHYHFRDVITFYAQGNYFFYKKMDYSDFLESNKAMYYNNIDTSLIYDRPDWTADARLDIHFNSHWTLYSDNHFAGKRKAMTLMGPVELKPTIEVNAGIQYTFNRWLMFYAQANNILNRQHDIYYGYQSQGLNVLVGFRWVF